MVYKRTRKKEKMSFLELASPSLKESQQLACSWSLHMHLLCGAAGVI